jgi:hypothetical protein
LSCGSIVTIVIMLGGIVGFILSYFGLKKAGRKKVKELRDHLDTIGVKSWTDDFAYDREKDGKKRSGGYKYLGKILLSGKEIDSIVVTGVASQYGINYYLDFMVSRTSLSNGDKSKVKLARRKIREHFSREKTQNIIWKGDTVLAKKLDADTRLKEKLLRNDLKPVRYTIEIVPEQQGSHDRIRTAYFLPSIDILEVLNIVAKHMKSW